MTFQEFTPIFAMLAVQLRATDADEATARAYFQALQHCEVEFVKDAAIKLGRATNQDGESWFPKTGEWLTATTRVEWDRKIAQQAFLRSLPVPLCRDCSDSGWSLNASGRATRCSCQRLRRLELLGRRPYPALPPVPDDVVARELPTADSVLKDMEPSKPKPFRVAQHGQTQTERQIAEWRSQEGTPS